MQRSRSSETGRRLLRYLKWFDDIMEVKSDGVCRCATMGAMVAR